MIVIKCGGSTLNELSPAFYEAMVELWKLGKYVVLVHGGGPHINQVLHQLKVESTFINGLRKTTKEVLETVEMVLCGKVNKQLVTSIQLAGAKAIGLSGCDGNLLMAKPIDLSKLGFVGEPVKVNDHLLHTLLQAGYMPIIASIATSVEGQHYNVNADHAAAAVANSLGASQLVFVTDVDGILKDGEPVKVISKEQIDTWLVDGTIHGGMIPKVTAALKSLTGQMETVVIMNGKSNMLFANGEMLGTKIVATTKRFNSKVVQGGRV
nr:acetylglutamate kinase [Bacillus sp. FJAT-45037]